MPEPTPTVPFAWQSHHFIAGSAALDFANTVVYRLDPRRREDRLRVAADVDAWARAAGIAARPLEPARLTSLIAVREAIDALFRLPRNEAGGAPLAWVPIVRLYAVHVGGLEGPSPTLAAVLLHEAVRLRFAPQFLRIKACEGCGWLFIDRTRNNSKRWCIAALCGNRDKARRHYHRRKITRPPPGRPSSPP